ncbi:MAG TPA: DMT family transporter, partial [Terriglobales bacterium]|nr:DMT family transporter [Terriglobales bacterium]
MYLAAQGIAVICAMSYAAATISARFGMKHSNPVTMTLISFTTQTVVLWTMALLSGRIPALSYFPAMLFVGIGFIMPVLRMLTYIGVTTLGASRSISLRSSHPLFSAFFAFLFLNERLTPLIVSGTILVVIGTFFITWQRDEGLASSPWWYALFPLSAAAASGLIQPAVRYGLGI